MTQSCCFRHIGAKNPAAQAVRHPWSWRDYCRAGVDLGGSAVIVTSAMYGVLPRVSLISRFGGLLVQQVPAIHVIGPQYCVVHLRAAAISLSGSLILDSG